jgi:hypothetical protein
MGEEKACSMPGINPIQDNERCRTFLEGACENGTRQRLWVGSHEAAFAKREGPTAALYRPTENRPRSS